MRELGLVLSDELLALSAASHWGEQYHVAGVRTILHTAGLDESALRTPPSLPEDPEATRQAIVAGQAPMPILHGCSGKHAAMLATCVLRQWPTPSYLDPAHPMQQELRSLVERGSGEPIAHEAVDGCGAPAWTMSLTALANTYREAVLASPSSPLGAVAAAMRTYPAVRRG